MIKLILTMGLTASTLPNAWAAGGTEVSGPNHDPTLVVERTQTMLALFQDLQKPNPPQEAVRKFTGHLRALNAEVRDLADQLAQCRAGGDKKKAP